MYINWIVLFIDNNETTDTRVKFYCLFHEVNLEIFSLINAPLLENVNAPGAFIRRNTVYYVILTAYDYDFISDPDPNQIGLHSDVEKSQGLESLSRGLYTIYTNRVTSMKAIQAPVLKTYKMSQCHIRGFKVGRYPVLLPV